MASNIDKAKFVNKNPKENTILAFTTGEGEPRAINVERCIDELDQSTSLNAITLDTRMQNDFNHACPRVPLLPISFEFDFDSNKSSGNFENVNGFQFSYQVVYKNGSTSSIAPYSDVAYAPAIINLGTKSVSQVQVENRCVLFIPKVSVEAKFIRLVVREGNNDNPRVVDQFRVDVESDDFIVTNDDFLGQYSFYNDKIGTLLSDIDANKTFDNVPRNAKSQTVADNRVMYGNYTEGYSNITTDVNLSVEFKQAPPPGFSFDLKVVPYLFRKRTDKLNEVSDVDLGRDRYKTNSGFVLDTSGFPADVPAGVYSLSVTVSPRNNYHLFAGVGSDANSRENMTDDFDNYVVGTEASSLGSNNPTRAIRAREMGAASQFSSDNLQVNGSLRASYFSGNYNTSNSLKWESSNGDMHLADIGRSYSSPLIFKGEPVTFSATIQLNSGATRETFSKAIVHALCGLSPQSSPLSGNGSQIYPSSSVEDYFKEVSYDLGLQDDSFFGAESSLEADLVCSVSSGYNNNEGEGTLCSREPEGFFVVNKATMRFCGEPALGYAGEQSPLIYEYEEGKSGYGVIMSFAHAKDVNVKTVIPFPEEKFASAASVKATQQSQIITSSDESVQTRARRFLAMGTGKWDWRYDENSNPQILWPSCFRQWKTPDGVLNGPSLLQTSDSNSNFYAETGEVDGLGTVFLSGGDDQVLQPGVLPSKRYSGGVQTSIGDDFRTTAYHPAPIKRWLVVGGEESDVPPSDKGQGYWDSINGVDGFSVAIDVPSSAFSAEDVVISGDPSKMLGGLSKFYCGQLRFYDSGGFFTLGRDIEYSAPDPTVSVDSYQERGTLSLIDGEMGPGGMNGIAANQFGDRSSDKTFGYPFAMGCHDLGGSRDENVLGSMANIRGSVTNFGLLGYVDNCPGFVVSEIQARTRSNVPVAQQPETFWTDGAQNGFYSKSYVSSIPQFADIGQEYSSIGSSSDIIRRSDLTDGYWTSYYSTPGSSRSFEDLRTDADAGGAYNSTMSGIQQLQPPSGSTGGAVTVSGASVNTGSDSLGYQSFKTKANHEFGLVYYDERGRHGAVQPVGSVYVPGYDTEDRAGQQKGGAKVKMEINHAPPSWATDYRVAYSGNTSISEFIQHTVAGGYVSDSNKNRIYVSLNHLQSSKISYAEDYGAVSLDDGTKSLYRFNQGDRLRVINYSNAVAQLEYAPKDFDFRIVSLEVVAPDMENHPFPGNESSSEYNGEFLVLENNKEAQGFRIEDIESESSLWGSRCLVEIYRPAKALGDQSRAYYELNYGGNVIDGSHQFNTIIMSKGDVFFRSVPMNVQNLNEETENVGDYSSLLTGDVSADTSESSFVPYYVESESVTDIYRSDAKSYGRVHFADRFADEVDRPSSITFSEKTFQGSYDLRHFSFPRIGNFKDLPSYSGGIDVMSFQGTHIMSFNDSKVYYIPVSRDVLTTGETDAIVASTKVLGSEIAVPIDGGSSKRPESVISINNDFFFFDERNERVVMIKNGKTPVVITNANVDSYFKSEVRKWKESGSFKAPSGYDPKRSEYLISLSSFEDAFTYHDYSSARDRMLTMSFDLKSQKFWKSRYSFAPHFYSSLNGKLISFHSDFSREGTNITGQTVSSPAVFPCLHDDNENRNKIYGKNVRSSLCVSANSNSSKVKEFSVVVLDSDNRWECNLYTPSGESSIPFAKFKGYNDKYYGRIPGVVSQSASQKSSQVTKTTIPTMPYAFDERKIVSTNQVLQNQFLGPRYFSVVNSDGDPYHENPTGERILEFRMLLSKNSTAFNSPIALGKKSALYESLPNASEMVPLGSGPQNAHAFDRKAYVSSEESNDSRSRTLVVRAPFAPIVSYCNTNGHADVVEKIMSTQSFMDESTYLYDASANSDQAGYKLFDIVFAPYYSMFFGSSIESTQELNNLIALGDGEGSTSTGGYVEYTYDLNDDGNVGTLDLLDFLAVFGSPSAGVNELLALLSEFGSEQPEVTVEEGIPFTEISQFTAQSFLSLYGGSQKQIHSVYTGGLNAAELTGRYMKIDLISDNVPDNSELFEISVDHDNRVKSMSASRKAKKK